MSLKLRLDVFQAILFIKSSILPHKSFHIVIGHVFLFLRVDDQKQPEESTEDHVEVITHHQVDGCPTNEDGKAHWHWDDDSKEIRQEQHEEAWNPEPKCVLVDVIHKRLKSRRFAVDVLDQLVDQVGTT